MHRANDSDFPGLSPLTARQTPAPPSALARRIMLLSTDMGMGGGAEEQVIQLALELKSRGWVVTIVSMLPPSPMPPDFDRSGVALVHLAMRRGIPDLRPVWRLARLIRQLRPDVVHSHMNQANLLARVTRMIQPFPALVCTLHALTMAGMNRDRTTLFELAHRVTDGLADCTTAICQAAADYYIRRKAVPAGKMRLMHNGIDTARFAANRQSRDRLRRQLGLEHQFVWLAVGRLEVVKAYPTLLRAFARLGAGDRALLICGQGSQAQALRDLAAGLGIGRQVRFLGLRDDIPDIISAADAFALSSDSEGLPLVLLQASAAGLPIVATDVGGNGEAVIPEINGRLVPAGDQAAFADAMRWIETLPPADRLALGQSGRERVRNQFEFARIADQWEEIYARLLDNPVPSARLARSPLYPGERAGVRGRT